MPTEEDVKKTIRVLLNSSKGGCSPRQLMNDYKFVTGASIPFTSFGYDSLMSYLSSLKDVLTVSRSRDRTTLHVVSSPAAANVAKVAPKPRHSSSGIGYSKPELSAPTVKSSSTSTVLTAIPATVKTKFRSLMLSYPNGILLTSFQEAFARRFSYYFSFRTWGYSSLEEMVRALPSVLQLVEDPVKKVLVVKGAPDSSPSGDEVTGIDWAKLSKERKDSDEKVKEKPSE